jgi:hypothetical protein
MPTSNDPTEADDLDLIGTLAEQLGWSRWTGDEQTVIKVGDPEVQLAIAVRNGVHVVEKIDRGWRRTLGTFDSGAEARRFLIMELAASARNSRSASTDPRSSGSQQIPPGQSGPAEVPPADDFADLDRPVIEKAAHELGWRLLPAAAPDVLLVGSDGVGRVITFRQGSYVYDSFAGDRRSGKASFPSFRCARRFMIMDMATILRMQRRLPTLRPSQPAAGFSIERAPTGYGLIGPDCEATFSIGPVGHRYSLDFSRVAGAEPDQILASFLDPHGAPLFT